VCLYTFHIEAHAPRGRPFYQSAGRLFDIVGEAGGRFRSPWILIKAILPAMWRCCPRARITDQLVLDMAPGTQARSRYLDYVRQSLANRIPKILEMAGDGQDAAARRQLQAIARRYRRRRRSPRR
jgi:hypothetical protein